SFEQLELRADAIRHEGVPGQHEPLEAVAVDRRQGRNAIRRKQLVVLGRHREEIQALLWADNWQEQTLAVRAECPSEALGRLFSGQRERPIRIRLDEDLQPV